jgi:hypothetical protein
MPKDQNTHGKRRREIEKRRKAEEKRARRRKKKEQVNEIAETNGNGKAVIPGMASEEDEAEADAESPHPALAFRFGLAAEGGVILLRLSRTDRESDNQGILEALESRSDWEGRFSVVEQTRIRVRPLRAQPHECVGTATPRDPQTGGA